MIRSRTGMATATLVAVMVASGCGGGGSSEQGYQPLTKADFAQKVSAATKAQKSARMTLTVGSLVHTTAEVDYDAASPRASMKTVLSYGKRTLTMDVRVLGATSYISVTGITPAGKFVKVDKDTPGSSSLTTSDPSKLTDAFAEGATKVNYVGTTKIDGATAYHYTVVVDAAKSLGALGLSSLAKSTGAGAPGTMTEQLYLNSDDTLRRGTVEVSGRKGRFDITGWGDPVTVKAPPASKVITLGSSDKPGKK